jgi:hypothetical protein
MTVLAVIKCQSVKVSNRKTESDPAQASRSVTSYG